MLSLEYNVLMLARFDSLINNPNNIIRETHSNYIPTNAAW